MSIERLLDEARATYVRVTSEQAHDETSDGALIVDIRPAWQRSSEVPGSLIIERNHLEWRLDPTSDARVPAAQPGQRWIVLCQEGYASSLAAASLRSIGVDATDVTGGIEAWEQAGLPLVEGPTHVGRFVGSNTAAPALAPLH